MSGLKELQQWICDTCRDVIESPQEGWLEWLESAGALEEGASDFRIVHAASGSQGTPCRPWMNPPAGKVTGSLPLDGVVGSEALPFLLSKIDPGPYLVEDFHGPYVASLREWAELARRLMVPGYEEARQYLPQAVAEGLIDDWSEMSIYRREQLASVVSEYRDRL
ncbi:MAG: hypothetical protein WD942_00795 [Dehalococcoidia bacterium]